MEKSKLSMFLTITTIVFASMNFQGSHAKEHIVGNRFGWSVPPEENFYQNWASHETFQANDVLVFNFINGLDTVEQVSKAAYDMCDGSKPISYHTTSPARITIDPKLPQYYICSAWAHCRMFQKVGFSISTAADNSSSTLLH
ncbi:hypothetical protein QVD17_33999 [Tagetes erecta]|uniref:Phytocyanin domain-containing protein n=1 Tax=Tagetes erecta TaxID=13708 RepID=A0AAD8JY05_TARER|nr:hypothetical protein QVD17_33999 [Tagetes erecta]